MNELTWEAAPFAALPAHDLYAILAARQDVFVLEQQCFYPDMDGHDQAAHHLMGWTADRKLAAYLRVLAPGAKYTEASIGRVLTTSAARGTGAGRELVRRGIGLAAELHPGHRLRIGAQAYLERFYASFGFVTVSAPYDEDGIQHVDMLR
jgi:ElaA protein